jgi:hypothetical protein
MQALLNQSSVLLAAMEASINNSHLEPHTSHYTPMLYKKNRAILKTVEPCKTILKSSDAILLGACTSYDSGIEVSVGICVTRR